MGGVGSSLIALRVVYSLELYGFNALIFYHNKQVMFIRAWGPVAGSNGQQH